MQPNLAHVRRAAQFPPEIAERIGVIRAASVIDDDVLTGSVVLSEPQSLDRLLGLGSPQRRSSAGVSGSTRADLSVLGWLSIACPFTDTRL